MIDLHAHTRCSDGTDSPEELVSNAVAAGLTSLAITDHDTTAGWDAASRAVADLEVDFLLLPGAEFSCVHTSPAGIRTTLHLLGYLFDPGHEALRAERERLRRSRLGRAEQMVALLAADGYAVSWSQVVDIAAGGAVGRPHIAQALVHAGAVSSVEEAFVDLIAKGSRYHVGKQDLDVFSAIELITEAGGVTVVAHVLARLRGPVLTERDISDLVDGGLAGIEVDHVDHSAADREILRRVVDARDLIATGSSDYHGGRKPNRLGCETTAPEMLDRILDRASGTLPVRSAVR